MRDHNPLENFPCIEIEFSMPSEAGFIIYISAPYESRGYTAKLVNVVVVP